MIIAALLKTLTSDRFLSKEYNFFAKFAGARDPTERIEPEKMASAENKASPSQYVQLGQSKAMPNAFNTNPVRRQNTNMVIMKDNKNVLIFYLFDFNKRST